MEEVEKGREDNGGKVERDRWRDRWKKEN